MKNLCTICMRGGSKGVSNKNTRELCGKPLMAYTIEQTLESNLFEHVVVSTDLVEIAETAKIYGAEAWFIRPAELASDKAPKIPVVRHILRESEKHYDVSFDVVVDLDVTSPLRKVHDIIESYQQFIDEDADILITACPAKKNPYYNMVELVNGKVELVKQLDKFPQYRQNAPQVFDMNASIYIWKREVLMNYDTLFVEKTSLYVMPEERSVDIDTQIDWDFVEYLIEKSKYNDY